MGGAKLLLIRFLLLLWLPVYQNAFHQTQQSRPPLIDVPKPQRKQIESSASRHSLATGHVVSNNRMLNIESMKFSALWRLVWNPETSDYRIDQQSKTPGNQDTNFVSILEIDILRTQ